MHHRASTFQNFPGPLSGPRTPRRMCFALAVSAIFRYFFEGSLTPLLTEFSRSLMQIYDKVEAAAEAGEGEALQHLRSKSLRDQFIEGVREPSTKRGLKR